MRFIKRLSGVMAVVALGAGALSAQPPSSRGLHYAFLVGVSNYKETELRPLPFTGDDVEAFRESLLATGFDPERIKVLTDKASKPRFLPERRKIMAELRLMLEGVREADTVVVALSGHGVHYKGDKTGYFCPLDAELDDKSTLIPMEGEGSLFQALKSCKASRKLLIVNACRNDPQSNLAQAARKVALDDEDSDEVPEGIAALYACKQGQKSYYDPNRRRSIFFDHVARAWKGEYQSGGEIALESFFESVIAKTKTDADNTLGVSQVPVVRREYKGNWKIPSVSKAARVPPEISDLKILKPDDVVDIEPAPAPKGALVLFDGKNFDQWTYSSGQPAQWQLMPGNAVQGKGGSAYTKTKFDGEFHLHAEFRVPYLPKKFGQARGNGGVLVQGRYEIQILDSYGLKSKNNDCGAIYGVAPPLINVCKAPTIWQSFDIHFTAPKFANGRRIEPARVTIFQNGIRIHDDVKIPVDSTPGGIGSPSTPGPIGLQDHADSVQYRNIWVLQK